MKNKYKIRILIVLLVSIVLILGLIRIKEKNKKTIGDLPIELTEEDIKILNELNNVGKYDQSRKQKSVGEYKEYYLVLNAINKYITFNSMENNEAMLSLLYENNHAFLYQVFYISYLYY